MKTEAENDFLKKHDAEEEEEAEPSRRAKRNLFDDDGSDGNEDEYVPKNYGDPVESK